MNNITPKKAVGNLTESQACKFLQAQGLKLIQRNFNCKLGEIDLIMQDGDTLVFIEVRFRKHEDFGGSIESVERRKQRKIIRAATLYLQQNNLYDKVPCRFDVIACAPQGKMDWIRNAFCA